MDHCFWKHLINPPVKMYIQKYLQIAVSYLEVDREVILERFQTLKLTKKSNMNQ